MRKLGAKSFKSIPGKYYDTPKELWGFAAIGVTGPRRRSRTRFSKPTGRPSASRRRSTASRYAA